MRDLVLNAENAENAEAQRKDHEKPLRLCAFAFSALIIHS